MHFTEKFSVFGIGIPDTRWNIHNILDVISLRILKSGTSVVVVRGHSVRVVISVIYGVKFLHT